MQISSRFTIALHALICMESFKNDIKVTSDFLASSINANPVVIRRLLQQLKAAGIVTVTRGSGGAEIAKPLDQISMLDVYHAVDCVESGNLFHFHGSPNCLCPVGRNIHTILDSKLDNIQSAMETEMKSVTIADLVKDTQKIITNE